MNQAGISDFAKDTVLSLLQEFFSKKVNVGEDFLFNPNPAESKILIADKYTVNLEEVAKRPAIVVIRGAQTWGNRGLGQFAGLEGRNTAETFTDLVQGVVNCTCLSKQGLEAERIGWNVFAFFQMFRRTIQNTTKGVHDIGAMVLGEELAAATDSGEELSVVPLSLNLTFQWRWALEERGPAFENLVVKPTVLDAETRRKNAEAIKNMLAGAKPAMAI